MLIMFFSVERESCIILEKTIWDEPTKRGSVKVNGKLFSLPLILVKLFREGFGEFPLSNLILYSRPDCSLSRFLKLLYLTSRSFDSLVFLQLSQTLQLRLIFASSCTVFEAPVDI